MSLDKLVWNMSIYMKTVLTFSLDNASKYLQIQKSLNVVSDEKDLRRSLY